VPVSLQAGRGKESVAWLGSGLSHFVQWRQLQHRAYTEESTRLAIAHWVVKRKLNSYLNICSELFPQRAGVAQQIAGSMELIPATKSIASLMGLEGSTAAFWYRELGRLLLPHWQFQGRNRRPPRDPVNALFSLGYTLALSAVRRQVNSSGLDPALGFLHEMAPARDALSLDLMEPLRANVDQFVLSLLDQILTPDDFTSIDNEGCRLRKETRSLFYSAWEVASQNWREQNPIPIGVAHPDGEPYQYSPASLNACCYQLIRDFRQELNEYVGKEN